MIRYLFTIIVLCFLSTVIYAQDLYEEETIQTIEITFIENNWDELLNAQKQGIGEYTMAQSVAINGVVLDSVGVKYKGNSTYDPDGVKNPFHIELDTYKDHDYQGYTDIKLSNVAKDPSFLREVLSYKILRQYMEAAQSNYANVYVNGNLIGLYSNTESISKKFVGTRFGSKNNAFFQCSPNKQWNEAITDRPDLVYLGSDSVAYYGGYQLKSENGWQELIDLTNTLANNVGGIQQILNIDEALWMLAYNNVLVNLDSYIGQFAQNYYLYQDEYGVFRPVVWDLNESFGQFALLGTGPPLNLSGLDVVNPFLKENDSTRPLISQLLDNPTYRRMYIAHAKTIVLENFDNGAYLQMGTALQEVIDEAVQNDNNKFYSYQNFIDNLTTDIGSNIPGITDLMDVRTDYLLGLSEFTAVQPVITGVTPSDSSPQFGETISITASISNAASIFLAYRSKNFAPFRRVEMFDDGMHNDGGSNDGIYGLDIPIENSIVHYYIYAENNNAGRFSPERAAFEYHTISAEIPEPSLGELVINELMASNNAAVTDQDGEYDDWIEFYNNGSSAIDMSGYFLTDNEMNLVKWQFPSGTILNADDYLVLWADEDEGQSGLHTNFKLSSAGETLYLFDNAGNIIDFIDFEGQEADVAFARIPNGTGSFKKVNHTFNAFNENSSSTKNTSLIHDSFELFPNPSSSIITLNLDNLSSKFNGIKIMDVDGKIVFDTKESLTEIDVSTWSPGMYTIKIGKATSKIIVVN